MALQTHSRLGPYEILAPLGAGGMGEVYRARDTRLDRTVAVKVLPSHLSSRSDLRERFEREARAISSLNHPHICGLYDLGHQDGVDFMVLEYIEGGTLESRLRKGPLPVEQAVRYAIEIADALDSAHRFGITHRDLKPANIMLTKSGAKLLDFGLAKQSPLQAARDDVPTMASANLTVEGSIVGTLQYMAPEQLEGTEADARTDIFAFGAVVYEMVTGRKAFQGKSQPSLISAIMSLDPPAMSTVQPVTPRALDRLVKHCLAKDSGDRWQTMHDVLLQLREIADVEVPLESSVPSSSNKRERAVWVTALLLLVLLAGIGWWRARGTGLAAGSANMTMLSVLPPEGLAFTGGSTPSIPVISPDGRQLALTVTGADGRTSLWVRALDSTLPAQLPDTQNGHDPFWSPDGQSVGFFANGKLRKIALPAGPAQTLCDAGTVSGGSWNRDGVIIFGINNTTGLRRVSADGGVPAVLTTPDAAGKDLADKFPANGFSPGYANGQILFIRGSILMSQDFDSTRLEVSGEPRILLRQVDGFSVGGGMLALRQSGEFSKTELVWLDRSGKVVSKLGEPAEYANPALSPDGSRVAIAKQDGPNVDIWILDAKTGNPSRLTFNPSQENGPVWSPDGTQIAFASNRTGQYAVYEKNADGSGVDTELVQDPTGAAAPTDWSTGRVIAYVVQGGQGGLDMFMLPLDDPGKPLPFLQTRFKETHGRFSHDGSFVAYQSDESGRDEIYVGHYPSIGARLQVSTAGGDFPRWRRDGKELFYLQDANLMAVDIKLGSKVEVSTPHLLFKTDVGGWLTGYLGTYYDVTGDGQRFLFTLPVKKSTFHIHGPAELDRRFETLIELAWIQRTMDEPSKEVFVASGLNNASDRALAFPPSQSSKCLLTR